MAVRLLTEWSDGNTLDGADLMDTIKQMYVDACSTSIIAAIAARGAGSSNPAQKRLLFCDFYNNSIGKANSVVAGNTDMVWDTDAMVMSGGAGSYSTTGIIEHNFGTVLSGSEKFAVATYEGEFEANTAGTVEIYDGTTTVTGNFDELIDVSSLTASGSGLTFRVKCTSSNVNNTPQLKGAGLTIIE